MPTTSWSIASSGALSGRSASRRKAIRNRSGRCSAAASGYAGIGVRRSRNDDERDFEDVEVTGVRGGDGQQTFGFLLLPQFSMLAFSSAVEPLRAANRLSGKTLYDWRILTADGTQIHSHTPMHLLTKAGTADSAPPDSP